MNLPIVFMFSGQGSQYYQMGKELFEQDITFKNCLLNADAICQDIIGDSIIHHLYHTNHTKAEPFTNTLLTHPAIFMVEYGMLQILMAHKIQPDYVLGTSMGEFAAAVAAGLLTFESALITLLEQAKCLQICPEAGMLAILNNVNFFHEQNYLYDHAQLAAINFPGHFVVTGQNHHLLEIAQQCKSLGIATQLLPVSVGFHSDFIDAAKIAFLNKIHDTSISESEIPFISCVNAEQLKTIDRQHLWSIIRDPILFQKAIENLEQEPKLYVDIGPSGTLATFVKYNLKQNSASQYLSMLNPLGNNISRLNDALTTLKQIV